MSTSKKMTVKELRVQLALLEERNAQLEALAAQRKATLGRYLQCGTHATFPKGSREDMLGTRVRFTLEVEGEFKRTKNGNVGLFYGTKVPESVLTVVAEAPKVPSPKDALDL